MRVATPTQMKRRGRWSLVLGSIFAALTLGAVLASGAELVTAEVTGTLNDVTVTQGSSTSSSINLTATGAIACTITSLTPATATVNTSYSLSSSGSVTSSAPSAAKNFFSDGVAGGGGNCGVTWTGAPTAYSVIATFSAAATTPVGTYPVQLVTAETNPAVSGGKLGDATPTSVTVHVVAPTITDTDGDGVADSADNCPTVANAGQADADNDGKGDACDAFPNDPLNDADGDGFGANVDNCPFVSNPSQADADNDGKGDACDAFPNDPLNDADGDGFGANVDNCPSISNPSQADADNDGIGDACDTDSDGDGVTNASDNCPTTANADQADNDADSQGDVCDSDDDNDTVLDANDNCQFTANLDQLNTDGDSQGDACDADDDNDGVLDAADNCPVNANSGQADSDTDGLGDVCDPNAFAPEVAVAADDPNGPEGSTLAASGSFSDADPDSTLSVTKQSGAGTVHDDGGGAWSWSHQPDDNFTNQEVVVQVSDGEHTTTNTFHWTSTNVAPTAAINGAPASSPEGTQISLTSTVSDPGTADTHTYAWSVTKNGSPYGSGGTNASFSFTPDDNGTYVVSLTVTDDDGGSGSDSETINVTNVAPTATINGAPASSPEGTQISLTSAVSDPGTADTHTYAWSVTKNGNPYGPGGTNASFSFTPDDNASYEVKLTITDDDGGSGSDTETITVTNVDPTATINGAPASSPEGTLISLTSSKSDPGSADTHTYAWSVKKDGSAYASATTQDFSFTPDDNASYEVKLTITDDDGGSGSNTKTITGTNVAPTINNFAIAKPAGAACTLATNKVTVSFTVSDPADQAADPITGNIDWGDGSSQAIDGRTISKDHNYAPGGPYIINVTVNDGDSGVANAGGPSTAFSLLYNTSGILQPINTTGSRSAFKIGSTIPVKIKVTDCNGASVSGLTLHVKLQKLDNSANPVNEIVEVSVPDVGDTMRYDTSGLQYIYNLSTKRSQLTPQNADLTTGSYRVTVYNSVIAPTVADFDAK
jgi:hypothetical protein